MQKKPDQIILAPTDLSNFLSCHHLSSLDLIAASGELQRPARYGALIDELQARGRAHEQAYLEHLQASGLDVASTGSENDGSEKKSGVDATLYFMRQGADVIYQPGLSDENWSGRADFLLKVDTPSKLGDYSYEVADTKLARETRGGTILQLCVYSLLLEKLQGVVPQRMHVVTPGNDYQPLTYFADEYSAYFRYLKTHLGEFLQGGEDTYPDMVSHCDLCAWWEDCEKRRRGDDNLCYVAGISKLQMAEFESNGITRLADLARLDDVPVPERGTRQALEVVRDQARMQLIGRERQQPYYELKEPLDDNHGLSLLPEPTTDDIFLDFEGNHFAEGGPQEYLTGYVVMGPGGSYVYTPIWAQTLEQEKRAFEQFIDAAMRMLSCNSNAHIYHFAPYETAALKRLMGRHATREVELDKLLRGDVFVDLHRVVKRAVIASVEQYSIKDLEPFFGYNREQELREASMSRRVIENILEAGEHGEGLGAHQQIVENYNREDCESTHRLREWLEDLRTQALNEGHGLQRPEAPDADASDAISELDQELHRLRDALLEGVPSDPEERNPEQQARFALAHMMEFHRREDKANWWEYFRLLELEELSFADERRALTSLRFETVVEATAAPLQRYQFPHQELDARKGDNVYDQEGSRIGSVVAVDYGNCNIDIKKSKASADQHPSAVIFHNQVPAKVLQESLIRLGEYVLANGCIRNAPYCTAVDLLLRNGPGNELDGYILQNPGEGTVEAACRLTNALDAQVLAVQGPPGTGKTYIGAHIICTLVEQGLKVGVVAVSHKVIVNLLEGAIKEGHERGQVLRVMHKQTGQYEGDCGIQRVGSYPRIKSALENNNVDVVGATAWCWSRPDFEQSVDVLIVDEAGQMSLSNVLAVCPGGRNLVLLGDPQQLEQPLQSSHPEGSEISALSHWLGGEDTMPAHLGLFLGETYRLHPAITKFTSEIYYERKLSARPELANQTIFSKSGKDCRFAGAGLQYFPVPHTGNQAKSPEEAAAIPTIVDELLGQAMYQDKDQQHHELTAKDILIVAPYNAQVAALSDALPSLAGQIGTVDRFQGQEAPVVIYSMTSSSPQDAPRGMEFLYDGHRFNVATSRARALCILVGSPALFEPECKTPHQMKMANGFCRYLELARVVE